MNMMILGLEVNELKEVFMIDISHGSRYSTKKIDHVGSAPVIVIELRT